MNSTPLKANPKLLEMILSGDYHALRCGVNWANQCCTCGLTPANQSNEKGGGNG